MWGPPRASHPADQEKQVRPAEGSIWKEDMPKTQKSNRGLERKCTSRLWKTKGRKKKRKEGGGPCECRARPLPTRLPAHPVTLLTAPLRTGRHLAIPILPPPCCSVSASLLKSQLLSAQEAGSVSQPQLVLGAGRLPRTLGPGEFRPESSQGWGSGSEG